MEDYLADRRTEHLESLKRAEEHERLGEYFDAGDRYYDAALSQDSPGGQSYKTYLRSAVMYQRADAGGLWERIIDIVLDPDDDATSSNPATFAEQRAEIYDVAARLKQCDCDNAGAINYRCLAIYWRAVSRRCAGRADEVEAASAPLQLKGLLIKAAPGTEFDGARNQIVEALRAAMAMSGLRGENALEASIRDILNGKAK